MASSDFRVSNRFMVDRSLSNLQRAQGKLADIQETASSLKKLRRPSDAPSDVVSSMTLHSSLARNEQLSRNIDDALGWLGAADNALSSIVDQMQRVSDLVVQARNPAPHAVANEAIATEIEAIRDAIIGVANVEHVGRPLFGGTTSGDAAYSPDGTYLGVSDAIQRTIAPGQRVQVNVNGDEVFGTAGNDLFTTLTAVADAVRTDPAGLDALAPQLQTRIQAIQTQLSTVGSRFQRVEAMKSQNSADALTMRQNVSQIEDADLAEVMMNLQSQQVAYQAALQATARAIQPSLADFLR
jgi:flagellar hook-associated protein 3 FlgL